MSKYLSFILVAVLLMFLTCSREERQERLLLAEIESILPGNWQIESFFIAPNNNGFEYQSQTIFVDTTLLDVGELFVPTFFTDSLDLQVSGNDPVILELTIDSLVFPMSMEKLFVVQEGFFAYFRGFIGQDTNILQTEAGRFVDSSLILGRNHTITIIDDDTIEIEVASIPGSQLLRLVRK